MKCITAAVVSILLLIISDNAHSQKKGEIHFGLGSGLFNFSSNNYGTSGTIVSNTSSDNSRNYTVGSISAMVGMFPADRLRLDAGISMSFTNGSSPSIYATVGGRYFYVAKEKFKVNGGISLNTGITTLINENPINLTLTPVEIQYWPLEGGAITTDLSYTRGGINLESGGLNTFSINAGLLIRLH